MASRDEIMAAVKEQTHDGFEKSFAELCAVFKITDDVVGLPRQFLACIYEAGFEGGMDWSSKLMREGL